MQIKTFSVYGIRIPLKFTFSHNLSNRFQSESIIVKICDELGNTGFGEGAPRFYVTGEDLFSCEKFLKERILPWIVRKSWNGKIRNVTDLVHFLKEFHTAFPSVASGKIIAWNAAKCAVELAMLDCLFHRLGCSFQDFFPLKRNSLRFGTGIGAYSPLKSTGIALLMNLFGFRDLKIKLNRKQDLERISHIRTILGNNIRIRLDANSAYNINHLKDVLTLSSFREYDIISIEQPFVRGHHTQISKIKNDIGIPLMADESLITFSDAEVIVQEKSYDAFNLRISKLGGIYPFIKILELAKKNNIWYQIGCHVGELAILSKIGQLLAAHFVEIEYLEGSYGNWLLKSDIDINSPRIGYGGRLKITEGKGFGFRIADKEIQKYSLQSEVFQN